MERLSDLLRALEDRGASLDYQAHGLVLLVGPETDVYVRTADVRRIEAYWRGREAIWSRVYVARPTGELDVLTDTRRPALVQSAVKRAEQQAAKVMLDSLLSRVGG